MDMTFHGGIKEVVLFDGWKVTVAWQYVLTLFAVCALAIVKEYVANTHAKLAYHNKARWILTVGHVLHVFFHFVLMLLFMTFNYGICAAVLVGSGIGFYFFNHDVFSQTALPTRLEH